MIAMSKGTRTYSGGQDKNAEDETDPCTSDTEDSLERNLVKGVSLKSPSLAETNVSKADGAPGEESSKTGKREEPVEDNLSVSVQSNVCQSTSKQVNSNGWKRTSRLVNEGEDLWCVTFLSQSSEGTGATVDARDTNGQDGNQDDSIDEVVETVETGVLDSQHKWRGTVGVWIVSTDESVIIGSNEETDQEETEDEEESDTPENLLDSTWKSLDWVGRLSSCKTDQLGTREGESCSDEHGTETTETVVEGSWVIPCAGTPILAVTSTGWSTTANEDDSSDHEDNNSSKLQAR